MKFLWSKLRVTRAKKVFINIHRRLYPTRFKTRILIFLEATIKISFSRIHRAVPVFYSKQRNWVLDKTEKWIDCFEKKCSFYHARGKHGNQFAKSKKTEFQSGILNWGIRRIKANYICSLNRNWQLWIYSWASWQMC